MSPDFLKSDKTLNYTTRNIYDKFGRLDVLLIPSDNPDYPLALKHHYHDLTRSGVLYKITDDRSGMKNKIHWQLKSTNAAGQIENIGHPQLYPHNQAVYRSKVNSFHAQLHNLISNQEKHYDDISLTTNRFIYYPLLSLH